MTQAAAPTFAASPHGDVVDCGKLAAACIAAVEVPEDLAKLDKPALEQLVITLTNRLEVAKRVLLQKESAKAEPEVKPLRHVDSFAINQERLPHKTKPEAVVPLQHVNSMDINRQRLPEEPSFFGMLEGTNLYATIAVIAAVTLASAFIVSRRHR